MHEVSPTVYSCNTCHIRLAPKICKLNKNGNTGKAYVSCHMKSRDGTYCSYYYWLAEAVKGSPPSSPALSAPSSSPPLSAPPPGQPAPILSATQVVCIKRGCGMGWLHIDCPHKMCHWHCIEAGGCQVKTHLATNIVANMFANPCHASQMAPTFTQQYALEQAL
ncbi:hypothetical protein L208DRAFT_1280398 [Tricholoma matsutake]|nr:hypothetical protein L208DRAFT_1280398 [Tricholoma matsutake 945]